MAKKRGRPKLTDKFNPVHFRCQEELWKLVCELNRRTKRKKNDIMNEALYRFFEAQCPYCRGTGRLIPDMPKAADLIKTLEDFLDEDKVDEEESTDHSTKDSNS